MAFTKQTAAVAKILQKWSHIRSNATKTRRRTVHREFDPDWNANLTVKCMHMTAKRTGTQRHRLRNKRRGTTMKSATPRARLTTTHGKNLFRIFRNQQSEEKRGKNAGENKKKWNTGSQKKQNREKARPQHKGDHETLTRPRKPTNHHQKQRRHISRNISRSTEENASWKKKRK